MTVLMAKTNGPDSAHSDSGPLIGLSLATDSDGGSPSSCHCLRIGPSLDVAFFLWSQSSTPFMRCIHFSCLSSLACSFLLLLLLCYRCEHPLLEQQQWLAVAARRQTVDIIPVSRPLSPNAYIFIVRRPACNFFCPSLACSPGGRRPFCQSFLA